MRAALLALAVLTAVLASSSCKAFDEARLTDDAGVVGCVLSKPPARPLDGDATEVPPLTFALRDVSVEQGARWEQIGYDLDDLCTAEPERETECVPKNLDEGVALDGAGGVDNVFGAALIPYAMLFLGPVEAPIRAQEALGLGLTLVRLEKWNGRDEDASVTVVVTPAALGAASTSTGDAPILPTDGTLPPPPRGAPTDWFWADTDGFVGGDETAARQKDDNAYVDGRRLVARLPDRSRFVLVADTFSLEVLLSNVVFTARIGADGTTLEQAVVAGRWAIADVLATASDLGFCSGTEGFARLERFLDLNADLRVVLGTGGEGVECDAMSVGIELSGAVVQWAGLATVPDRARACM